MSSPENVRTALAKYREQPADGLSCVFPIHWQIDEEVCKVLREELRQYGAKWEVRLAVRDLHKQIPAKTGIYMFVYSSQLSFDMASEGIFSPVWILYVGRAGSAVSCRTLRDRYREEYSKYVGGNLELLWNSNPPRGRSETLGRYLTIYPLQYWYAAIESRERIELIEKQLIKLLSPPLNKTGRPTIRFLHPQPAFRSV